MDRYLAQIAKDVGRLQGDVVHLQVLKELEERLVKAQKEVLSLAISTSFKSEDERTRLRGKAEGVGLALSYLREMTR